MLVSAVVVSLDMVHVNEPLQALIVGIFKAVKIMIQMSDKS